MRRAQILPVELSAHTYEAVPTLSDMLSLLHL